MSSFRLRHWARTLIGSAYATKHSRPWVPHWQFELDTHVDHADIDAEIARIAAEDWVLPPVKGHPDIATIRNRYTSDIASSRAAGDDRSAVASARQLASLDMRDGATFKLFTAMITGLNAAALQAARASLKSNVVMHITCVPRLVRASTSVGSFTPVETFGISQVVVVGSEHKNEFSFDRDSMTLTVPAPDSYEHLPGKLIAAMAFLGLCGQVKAVLKVDDDHCLKSGTALLKAMNRVRRATPVQAGELVDSGALGLHSRTWHFGKTADKALGTRPHSLIGPSRWANGAAGYLINAASLRLMYWSYVYFEEQIERSLYEDMVVSDLIERQGGYLLDFPMGRILSAVEEY